MIVERKHRRKEIYKRGNIKRGKIEKGKDGKRNDRREEM
jgi:hypothetical protein